MIKRSFGDELESGKSNRLPILLTHAHVARNMREWRAEVEERVRHAVEKALNTDKALDESTMRRLTAEGRDLFYHRLREAAIEGIGADAEPAEKHSRAVPSENSHLQPDTPTNLPLIVHELGWRDKRQKRPSYIARSFRASFTLTLWITLLLVSTLQFVSDDTLLSYIPPALDLQP